MHDDLSRISDSILELASFVLSAVLHIGRPQRQIITQQLHDQGAVLVRLFTQCIELGDALIKGLLCQMAGALRRVQNLVIEHREVKGEAEANRVCWGQIGERNVLSSFVSEQSLFSSLLAVIPSLEFSKVTVIVTLHLQVEHLGFPVGGRVDKILVKEGEDIIANLCKLSLDLGLVFLDHCDVGGVSLALLLLLYAGNNTPRGAAGTYDVLVGHRQ
mmetsp:Transcript_3167/g.5769  ORF Transcript_3167/g.5769 Transcript_3167/m.5769 type:complete len:216 (+) Transcript_3167:213-860(+)